MDRRLCLCAAVALIGLLAASFHVAAAASGSFSTVYTYTLGDASPRNNGCTQKSLLEGAGGPLALITTAYANETTDIAMLMTLTPTKPDGVPLQSRGTAVAESLSAVTKAPAACAAVADFFTATSDVEAVVQDASQGVQVYQCNTTLGCGPVQLAGVLTDLSYMVAIDFDGSGTLDLCGLTYPASLVCLANDGVQLASTFTTVMTASDLGPYVADQLVSMISTDLDGNQLPDLLVLYRNSDSGSSGLQQLLGRKTAPLLSSAFLSSDNNLLDLAPTCELLAALDTDGDGALEALVAESAINLTIYRMQSSAVPVVSEVYAVLPAVDAAYAVAMGDWTADGKIDVALATSDGLKLSEQGDGQPPVVFDTTLSAGVGCYSALLADFNFDGLLDLVSNCDSEGVLLLFNQLAQQCPVGSPKRVPGACNSCTVPDTDTDGDRYPDCIDGCPADARKNEPGLLGCGRLDPSPLAEAAEASDPAGAVVVLPRNLAVLPSRRRQAVLLAPPTAVLCDTTGGSGNATNLTSVVGWQRVPSAAGGTALQFVNSFRDQPGQLHLLAVTSFDYATLPRSLTVPRTGQALLLPPRQVKFSLTFARGPQTELPQETPLALSFCMTLSAAAIPGGSDDDDDGEQLQLSLEDSGADSGIAVINFAVQTTPRRSASRLQLQSNGTLRLFADAVVDGSAVQRVAVSIAGNNSICLQLPPFLLSLAMDPDIGVLSQSDSASGGGSGGDDSNDSSSLSNGSIAGVVVGSVVGAGVLFCCCVIILALCVVAAIFRLPTKVVALVGGQYAARKRLSERL